VGKRQTRLYPPTLLARADELLNSC
jgi:hypothetical protein